MELDIREESLSQRSQLVILLVAACQGVALYFFYSALTQDWWPIENDPITAVIGLWLVLVPVTFILSFRHELAGGTYWALLLGLTGLLIPIGWYFGSAHVGGSMRELGFGSVVALATAYFIGLFWLKAVLHDGRWSPSYASLFAYSWHNFLSLALANIFSWLVVGLLFLWGALFKVINVDVFADLFSKQWFLIPAIAVSFGYAIILFRTQINAVGAVQRILRALFTILLPILGLVAALFVAFLPITGTDLIWQKGYGSGTILGFVLTVLFLFNAVFQDAKTTVYSLKINRLVQLIPVVLVVLVGLSSYGLSVRVIEYGFSVERLWAMIVTLFASGFVLLYSLLAVIKSRQWDHYFGSANKVMAAIICAVCVATITPLMSLDRITIANQVNRLQAGVVAPEKFDYAYLVRLGAQGKQAVDRLLLEDIVASNEIAVKRLERAIQTEGYDYANDFFEDDQRKQAFTEHLLVYPAGLELDFAALALQLNLSEAERCSVERPCALLALNINDDPDAEWVLLTPNFNNSYLATRLSEYAPGQYTRVGYLTVDIDVNDLIKSMNAGLVSAQPSAWRNIRIGDQLIRIGEPSQ